MKRLLQILAATVGGILLLLLFGEANKRWNIAENWKMPFIALAAAISVVYLVLQWRKNDQSESKN